jgi:hypothetical protein
MPDRIADHGIGPNSISERSCWVYVIDSFMVSQ